MRSWKDGVLLAGMSALACSGRYEVGAMDSDMGGSSGSGAGTTGTTSSSEGDGTAGTATIGAGGSGSTALSCLNVNGPLPLTGEFASPIDIWTQLAPFIWGDVERRPDALPAATTYAWAGQVVDQAFEQGAAAEGVSGGSWFVRRWLQLDEGAPLQGDYDRELARKDRTMLDALLLTSWEPGRFGAFSERSWLVAQPTIPRRALGFVSTVFAAAVPPPPAEFVLKRTVDPELPDREGIEAATAEEPCRGCHVYLNGPGFALGQFDSAGDYRDRDRGFRIDTRGTFALSERELEFDGIAELGAEASNTCAATEQVVERFLRLALAGGAFDDITEAALQANLERVTQGFIAGGLSYRALVRSFAQSALVLKPVVTPPR